MTIIDYQFPILPIPQIIGTRKRSENHPLWPFHRPLLLSNRDSRDDRGGGAVVAGGQSLFVCRDNFPSSIIARIIAIPRVIARMIGVHCVRSESVQPLGAADDCSRYCKTQADTRFPVVRSDNRSVNRFFAGFRVFIIGD